jgi:hypothetical protein
VVASFVQDSMGLRRSSMAQDLDFNITHALVVHEECVDLISASRNKEADTSVVLWMERRASPPVPPISSCGVRSR